MQKIGGQKKIEKVLHGYWNEVKNSVKTRPFTTQSPIQLGFLTKLKNQIIPKTLSLLFLVTLFPLVLILILVMTILIILMNGLTSIEKKKKRYHSI